MHAPDLPLRITTGILSKNTGFHPGIHRRKSACVYGEVITSKAFLEADRILQSSPPGPGCDLPRSVVALMLYSDATHIAQFGQTKLCLIYTYFGNGLKFVRGRPSANAGYNVASLPSVSFSQCCFIIISLSIWLSFQTRSPISFWMTHPERSAPLLAHCRQEPFHGCWKIIPDDEFMQAYEHGIVIDCGDGIRRRIYPRIFFYSADYPEKYFFSIFLPFSVNSIFISCCKVTNEVSNIGKPSDMDIRQSRARKDDEDRQNWVRAARSLVYQKGYVVNSTHIDDLLKADSLVPTEVGIAVLSSQTLLSEVIFRMPSLNDYINSDWTSLTWLLSTWCTNLNSAFGRPWYYTSFEFFTPRDKIRFMSLMLGDDNFSCALECLFELIFIYAVSIIWSIDHTKIPVQRCRSLEACGAWLRRYPPTLYSLLRQPFTLTSRWNHSWYIVLCTQLMAFTCRTANACRHNSPGFSADDYSFGRGATPFRQRDAQGLQDVSDRQGIPSPNPCYCSASCQRVCSHSFIRVCSSASAPGTSFVSTPEPSSASAPGPSSVPAPGTSSLSQTSSADVPPVQAALPSASIAPQSSRSGKRQKFFNIATPKTHFPPDYAEQNWRPRYHR